MARRAHRTGRVSTGTRSCSSALPHCDSEILSLPEASLISTLSSSIALPHETVLSLVSRPYAQWALIFYLLSLRHRTIDRPFYSSLVLHKRFMQMSREESVYAMEGIRSQLERGLHDFYYVAHVDFIPAIRTMGAMQSLAVWMVETGDFRMREILLTGGVIEWMLKQCDPSGRKQREFIAKMVSGIHRKGNRPLARRLRRSGLGGLLVGLAESAEWTGSLEWFRHRVHKRDC